jgi:hypothetical protein
LRFSLHAGQAADLIAQFVWAGHDRHAQQLKRTAPFADGVRVLAVDLSSAWWCTTTGAGRAGVTS